MAGELVVNKPRVGCVVHEVLPDGTMPRIPAMLVDNGETIRLTVPWESASPTSQLERWFGGYGVEYGDDPDRARYSYDLPAQLGFIDVHGSITLVGCRALRNRENFGLGTGEGEAVVQLAAIGGEVLNYDRVHSMRSLLPEFGDWMGLSSLDKRAKTGATGRLEELDIKLSLRPPIRLARRMNLQAVPSWQVQQDRYGPHQLRDESFIETRAKKPAAWQEHLALHQSVRELLDIAGWEPFGFEQIRVQRTDDPIRAFGGNVLNERWCPVRTYATRGPRSSKNHPRYLFRFEDIGTAGVYRWLALREKFQRGVYPVLSLLDDLEQQLSTQLTQSALGLEAIGYELALEAGMSSRKAAYLPFIDRMELIRTALPVPTVHSTWPSRASDAYNGVKHANRALPAPVDMWSVVRENCLAFRVWVASRLGVKGDRLRLGLSVDQARLSLNQMSLPAE